MFHVCIPLLRLPASVAAATPVVVADVVEVQAGRHISCPEHFSISPRATAAAEATAASATNGTQ